eukprot:GHVS01002620.1.p1 GENE.GHVS01002620.1~~GHVS01002620.1.p1  ORF type:complete len:288 (+),score=2.97 GHVS01002620.1:840-1703(+)
MRASRHWGWAVPLCGLLLLLLSMAETTKDVKTLSPTLRSQLVNIGDVKDPEVESMKKCAKKFEGNKIGFLLGNFLSYTCYNCDWAKTTVCYYSDINLVISSLRGLRRPGELISLWCTFDKDKNVIASTPRGNDVKLFEWHYPWKPVGPSFLNVTTNKGPKDAYMHLFNCAEIPRQEKKLKNSNEISNFAGYYFSGEQLCQEIFETGRLQYQEVPKIDIGTLSTKKFFNSKRYRKFNSNDITVFMKGSFMLFHSDGHQPVAIKEMRVNMVPTKSRKFAPTKATLFRKY